MPTLEFLPSIRDREIVTCRRCKTRQFPRNGLCVRCHSSLGVDYACFEIGALLDPRSDNHRQRVAHAIGGLLRILRTRRGYSQSQLAMRAAGCIARTYLSKAECGHVMLPLGKLLPIAKTLGLTAVILRFEGSSSLAAHPSSDRR